MQLRNEPKNFRFSGLRILEKISFPTFLPTEKEELPEKKKVL
jgi:hypothetical protein